MLEYRTISMNKQDFIDTLLGKFLSYNSLRVIGRG